MKTDYLIVGQGLAGSLLGWELMQRGFRVLLIDPGQENASRVAAGLINPVTGMRLVKTTDVDSLLPFAIQYYRQLEKNFYREFYIEKNMLRIIRSQKELEYCNKRLNDPAYRDYLDNAIPSSHIENSLVAPLGGIHQKQTGYLLTTLLLDCLKSFFISHDSFRQTDLRYDDLRFNTGHIEWKSVEAEKIVFCEGYKSTINPWFSWLPFQPIKGEILTFRSDTSLTDKIINFGRWLIPTGNTVFRAGATFDRQYLNTKPTPEGKQLLLNELGSVLKIKNQPEIISHQANVRPCTLDKNPFIGSHPENRQAVIFNGFGAKGSLQIPGFAKYLINHLTKNTPLPASVDIKRYYATHFTGSRST